MDDTEVSKARDVPESVTNIEVERQEHDSGKLAPPPPPPPPPDYAEDYDARQPDAPAPPSTVDTGVIRKLVLFSDGTGNSAAKAEKTNVWRMFQALDLTRSDQLAMYDDGVGTSTNKYLAGIGGAFGWGLKRNVIDLYKFVCRNYVDETTEIYGFGFSRGAFTIRVLMGLIAREGLVNFTSEEELHQRAVAAYGHFRRACFTPPPLSPVYLYRLARRALAFVLRRSSRTEMYRRQKRRPVARINFLGLWDTVSAYGMPIAELKPAINWLFWPMNFNDLKLSDKVERACHALSLDDERTTFHPIVWDETKEADQRRITQVWFAGVHANVGGGYPEDQLALVSLDWMMAQAQNSGLRLQAASVARTSNQKSSYARIYDARAGKGMFYRYSPRTIRIPIDMSSSPVLPIIHGSVIARMARGGDSYVPNSLPPKFLVLAPNGKLLPMAGFPDQATRHYMDAAAPKTPQILAADIAEERTDALERAIGELGHPDAGAIDFIRNTVWWRRVAYLTSSLVATAIVLFPWFGKTVHASLKSFADERIQNAWAAALPFICKGMVSFDKQFSGIIAGAIGAVEQVTPRILDSWLGVIAKFPAEFAVLTVLFLLSVQAGNTLRLRLRDYGNLAWHAGLRAPFRAALLCSEQQTMKRTSWLLLAFDMIFVALAILLDKQPDNAIQGLVLAAAMLNMIALARLAWHRRFVGILQTPDEPISPGLATQNFARAVRTSAFVRGFNRAIGNYCAPALFGVALLYLMAVAVNRIAFDVQGASGAFCESRIAAGNKQRVGTLTAAASEFSTDKLCWSSGLRLEKNTRYRVTVDASKSNWFDRTIPADPHGIQEDSFVHAVATPLKRWIQAPWFAPIAHVGKKGNDEFALKPCTIQTPAGPQADDRKVLVAEFTTRSDGELYLFVNDAVLAFPGIADYFYRNNRGTASVKVEQVREGDPSQARYTCSR